MRVRLARWGNSLAVRMPKDLVDSVGLSDGQELEAEARDGAIALRPATPRYKLEDIVEEMRRLGPEAEPELIEWGPDIGSEKLPEDDYVRHGAAVLRVKRG